MTSVTSGRGPIKWQLKIGARKKPSTTQYNNEHEFTRKNLTTLKKSKTQNTQKTKVSN